jgi:DNA-directed RNA polymerase I, II, and III subunit RPABC2
MSSKKEIEIDDEIDSESENEVESDDDSDEEESIDEITEIDNTDIEEDSILFDEINPEKELNSNKRVPDELRRSKPYLTKYEKVNLIGTRSKQISDGSDIYVISKNAITAVDISKLELKHGKCPYKIKRTMPDGTYELWALSELEILED